MTDIKSMTIDELKKLMTTLGDKPFRAKQIYSWLHEHLVTSYDEMTNLSKSLREKLKEYPVTALKMVDVQTSRIDGTQKYLFRLSDGNVIESVLMRYKHGNSVCISSQVGCRMGCRFCASTIGGLTRCLLPSEMLDQIYRIQALTGERVSNVVVMGTGEPLDNYENLLRFIHILTEDGGLHISQRNLTVSTCGLVPKIYDLAKEKLQMTLALSLHAPNDVKRRELMPIANKYDIEEVIDACKYYFSKTGRRVTFEYSLVAGVNRHRNFLLLAAAEAVGNIHRFLRTCASQQQKNHHQQCSTSAHTCPPFPACYLLDESEMPFVAPKMQKQKKTVQALPPCLNHAIMGTKQPGGACP